MALGMIHIEGKGLSPHAEFCKPRICVADVSAGRKVRFMIVPSCDPDYLQLCGLCCQIKSLHPKTVGTWGHRYPKFSTILNKPGIKSEGLEDPFH